MKKRLILLLLTLGFILAGFEEFSFVRSNYDKDVNYSCGEFSAISLDVGSAIVFKVNKEIPTNKRLIITMEFAEKINAENFRGSLDSKGKRLFANAISDKSGKKLLFVYDRTQPNITNFRLYYNTKKKFLNKKVNFKILSMNFTTEDIKDIIFSNCSYTKNFEFINGVFSGAPEDGGAALIFNINKEIPANKKLTIIMEFDAKMSAENFRGSLDSKEKRLFANAISDRSGKKLLFEYDRTQPNITNFRLYYNIKNTFSKKQVTFKIINITYTTEIIKDIMYKGANYTKDYECINNKFIGTPLDQGATLIFNINKDIPANKNLVINLKFAEKVNADNFRMSLDSPKGRLFSNPKISENKKELSFEFNDTYEGTNSCRLYYNIKKLLTKKEVSLEIVDISYVISPVKITVYIDKIPMEKRIRLNSKTMLFPRLQNQYDLTMNYLDFYHKGTFTFFDRPLFLDRTLAENPLPIYNKFSSPNGFVRDLKSAKEFVDGFSFFLQSNRPPRFLLPLKYATGKGFPNSILTETGPGELLVPEKAFKSIDAALKSEVPLRINGKLLLSSYSGDQYTPEQWQKFIDVLNQRYPNKILVTCEVRGTIYRLNNYYNQGKGKISEDIIEDIKENIRKYLRVVDGINFSASNHIINKKLGYPEYVFNKKSYENIIVPLLVSVLAEKEFNGKKILGLSAHKAYCQVRETMSNVDEECTYGLRSSLDIALKANPDYIIMPEWNEVNENTHLQPVVSDAQTNKRIIRAMLNKNVENVETIYPNLILSFRQENDISQCVPIELLSLPDDKGKPFSVVLELYSPNGKLVKTFPRHEFNAKEIEAKSYLANALEFAKYRYLIPQLTINDKVIVKSGLPHIRLTTPANIFHRYVKIPLRDLPNPELIKTQIYQKNGKIIAEGSAKSLDDIVTLELMANDIPLDAVDLTNEYKIPDGFKLFSWQRIAPTQHGYGNHKVKIKTLKGKIIPRSPHQMSLSGMPVPKFEGDVLVGDLGFLWHSQEFLFFATEDTILEVDYNDIKTEVKISDILKNSRFRELGKKGTAWKIIDSSSELPEVPFPINTKELSYKLEAPISDRENPVYYVRMITSTGRVFRSLPFSLIKNSNDTVSMPLWELSSDKKITVDIPKNLAKKITYNFNPKFGKILADSNNVVEYDAILGGYDYWTHTSIPAWAFATAPEWVYKDKQWMLNFEAGDYILINSKVFSKSAFSVEMDISFNELEKQTILNINRNEFSLKIIDGVLSGDMKTRNKQIKFSSSIDLETNKFYNIKIDYNLEFLKIYLDNKEIISEKISGRFYRGWLMTIGGHPVELKNTLTPEELKIQAERLKKKLPDNGFYLNATLKSLSIKNYTN